MAIGNRMSQTSTEQSTDSARGSAGVLDRNIQQLMEYRQQRRKHTGTGDRIAETISDFAGSMVFVYIHAAFYGLWILANLGVIPGVRPWDPTMVVLAMIASVEAIFVSTFILITQNRMAEAQDERAELNLQISLLAEHEVTKLISLVSDIATKLDVRTDFSEVDEMKKDVAPRPVMERIEQKSQETGTNDAAGAHRG